MVPPPPPPAVVTITIDRTICGGCRVDRSGPNGQYVDPPVTYCPFPEHKPACPQCGTRAGLVITHRAGEEHVDAVCPDDAHTWQLPDLQPKEFRDLVSKAQIRPQR